MNIWIAALGAVAIQPLVYLLRLAPGYLSSTQPLYGVGFMLVAVTTVAAACILIAGIPVFLLLRRFRRESWRTLALADFVLGAMPAVASWPRHLEGYSAGRNWHGMYVKTYIDGAPTSYAWLVYGEGALLFAIHGLVGALVFYAIWRWRQGPNNALQADRSPAARSSGR